MTELLTRLKVLADGKVSWQTDDGGIDFETLSWKDRWAVFGVHSYNWWWVRDWGTLSCGCVRNPITRRTVLIRWKCPTHCRVTA